MITYEYKIYNSDRNRYLDRMLGEAAFVWNHALALQKRYYSLFGSYVDIFRMKKHFAKRISRCRLGAQTVQEILERLDASYQRFFTHLAKRPPKFKKASRFGSFVFKQDGFKLNSNILVINKIDTVKKETVLAVIAAYAAAYDFVAYLHARDLDALLGKHGLHLR